MTETRKKIIELIEPFMEKTLEKGCIVREKYKDNFREISKGNYIKSNQGPGCCKVVFIKVDGEIYVNDDDLDSNLFDYDDEGYDQFDNIFDVIGHYDITSILKYIRKFKDYDFSLSDDGDFFLIERIKGCLEHIGTFPNKPLHLYTEQEDQALLDLFSKLK